MGERGPGGCTMSTPSTVHRYRIVVRDDCGDLLASLVEGLAIESGGAQTSVVASVRAEPELYGPLGRFPGGAQQAGLQQVPVDVSQVGVGPQHSPKPRPFQHER